MGATEEEKIGGVIKRELPKTDERRTQGEIESISHGKKFSPDLKREGRMFLSQGHQKGGCRSAADRRTSALGRGG